jgi:hypothetical protein
MVMKNNKLGYNLLSVLIILFAIMILLIVSHSLFSEKGRIITTNSSPDGKSQLVCRLYSSRFIGIRYFQVEIDNIAYYQYPNNSQVFARWENGESITLISNKLPEYSLKQNGKYHIKILIVEDNLENVIREKKNFMRII